MRSGFVRLLLLAAFVLPVGCADLAGINLGDVLSAGMPLDQTTVANGLKQALDVGTQRTTSRLSSHGGFGANPVLRLSLPGELGVVANSLRQVGFGAQVDALEESMNRAAEQAAARAVPVFASAIRSMTIADAFSILNGPEDAATQYFQKRTSASLRREFAPVTASAMQQVGLYDAYRQVVSRYNAIPFTKPPALDLEAYVTDETLTALFSEIAKEEARIRQDPGARSTALLRRVFGAVGASPPGETAGTSAVQRSIIR